MTLVPAPHLGGDLGQPEASPSLPWAPVHMVQYVCNGGAMIKDGRVHPRVCPAGLPALLCPRSPAGGFQLP